MTNTDSRRILEYWQSHDPRDHPYTAIQDIEFLCAQVQALSEELQDAWETIQALAKGLKEEQLG